MSCDSYETQLPTLLTWDKHPAMCAQDYYNYIGDSCSVRINNEGVATPTRVFERQECRESKIIVLDSKTL
jgi:hypothetical protein